jgi:hypothetical protein
LVEYYRYNQEEAINQEKFYVRQKRKFIQYYVPGGKAKMRQKFLMEDFNK